MYLYKLINKSVKKVLKKYDILNTADEEGRLEFFFSDAPDHAAQMVKIVMGIDDPVINSIDLDNFN